MISWVEISSAWNTFFHAPESCAVQVIFRLTLGCLLTVNALLLFPLLRDFYATDSLWNLNAWKKFQGRRRLCLLHLLPETTGSFRLLLLVHLLACVSFLIGYQFRVASIAVFVTLVSIHHRNSFILSSGDTVLRLMAFLMMFSNAADAVSLDAVHSTTVGFPQVDPWPTRLMQILLSTVYLRTVYWKLRGKMWWQGTAAWFPLWVDTFLRNRPPRWMLSPFMVKVATWGTLSHEVCLGTLIWVRELQLPVVIFGVVMHLIFDAILNLQLFSWVMAASLLLFLPPELADRVLVHDLTRPSQQVKGAGPLDGQSRRGAFPHPLVAFNEHGLSLGTAWQKAWTRDSIDTDLTPAEKRHPRKTPPSSHHTDRRQGKRALD